MRTWVLRLEERWLAALERSRFGRWLLATRLGRFLARYFWVYLIWRVFKWPVVALVGYFLYTKSDAAMPEQNGKMQVTAAATQGDSKVDTNSSARNSVKVGDKLPDFTAQLFESGKPLRDFTPGEARGKTVVLYFYPMDDTPGCTKQACGLRDASADYAKYNALILGVSRDDADSHSAFIEKYHLPFGLLIDADGKLREQLGNPDGSAELISRITYIIDAEGVVRHIIGGAGVSVDDHLAESLDWAKKLSTGH